MSGYETVVYFYLQCAEAFGWTQRQIDESDLEFLADMLIVSDKTKNKEESVYIDELF